MGWVVVQGLVTGQGQLRRAKAIAAAADLQQKVFGGMQQQDLQGGNCCSDLTVRGAGLGARLMLNGWREAGGSHPRRILEDKEGGELFRSGYLACRSCLSCSSSTGTWSSVLPSSCPPENRGGAKV